ncbi:MAG: iron transporter FeoA [Firmicutes bacterium]|nr:iron transporter FeoA [Bacillota bacterium]
MPLTMLDKGIEASIRRYELKDNTRKFLEGLGILPGTTVSVLSELSGNLILCVKGTRIAISKGIAQKLQVDII